MGFRWVVGGSFTLQAAPELVDQPSERVDLIPTLLNEGALISGAEREPLFSVPDHDPATHRPPVEIRLYAIPAGEILPLPGASGADVVASPHVYTSTQLPNDPGGALEIRVSPPEIEADRYIVLIVYGFAD